MHGGHAGGGLSFGWAVWAPESSVEATELWWGGAGAAEGGAGAAQREGAEKLDARGGFWAGWDVCAVRCGGAEKFEDDMMRAPRPCGSSRRSSFVKGGFTVHQLAHRMGQLYVWRYGMSIEYQANDLGAELGGT